MPHAVPPSIAVVVPHAVDVLPGQGLLAHEEPDQPFIDLDWLQAVQKYLTVWDSFLWPLSPFGVTSQAPFPVGFLFASGRAVSRRAPAEDKRVAADFTEKRPIKIGV
jgi:hypothetical protein